MKATVRFRHLGAALVQSASCRIITDTAPDVDMDLTLTGIYRDFDAGCEAVLSMTAAYEQLAAAEISMAVAQRPQATLQ